MDSIEKSKLIEENKRLKIEAKFWKDEYKKELTENIINGRVNRK